MGKKKNRWWSTGFGLDQVRTSPTMVRAMEWARSQYDSRPKQFQNSLSRYRGGWWLDDGILRDKHYCGIHWQLCGVSHHQWNSRVSSLHAPADSFVSCLSQLFFPQFLNSYRIKRYSLFVVIHFIYFSNRVCFKRSLDEPIFHFCGHWCLTVLYHRTLQDITLEFDMLKSEYEELVCLINNFLGFSCFFAELA